VARSTESKIRRLRTALAGLPAVTVVMLLSIGCNGNDPAESLTLQDGKANRTGWQEEFFEFAIDNLNRLEQYDESMQDDVVGRLNEWMPLVEPIPWTQDSLVEQLPDEYRRLPSIVSLADDKFTADYDGKFLREVIWLRDAAASARIDPAQRA